MATIRKRGNAWQVQIRPAGCPQITRTFKRKPLADAWARQKEAEIDRKGLVFNRQSKENITVGEMLIRYRDEVIPSKRGQDQERYVLRVFLRNKIVRRHINWNNQRPDLKEDLAHLVDDFKRRICDVASAGFPSFSV